MARMVFSEVVGTMSFLRPQCDDDSVDRLHYYYTTTFLLVVAVLISLKMFGGSPIECWLPAEFRPSWQEYTELVCWSMSTFFVRDALAPSGTKDPQESDRERTVAYYQWTPFFLVFSAVLFYSPCVVWRKLSAKSGLVLNEIVGFAMAVDHCPTVNNAISRTAKLRGIAAHLSSAFRHRFRRNEPLVANGTNWWKFWDCEAIRYHQAYLATLYMAIKGLSLGIVFIQACLLNRFLQTDQYDFYGFGVLRDLLQGRAWSDSGNFPRITFCDIDVRIFGSVQRYTVQCILVINIFTEKVFVFLWAWYSLLLLITICNALAWLLVIVSFQARKEFVARRLHLADLEFSLENCDERIDKFVCDFLKLDGCFVLRMLDVHTSEWVCAEILDLIWEEYRQQFDQEKGLLKGHQQTIYTEKPSKNAPKGLDEISTEPKTEATPKTPPKPSLQRRAKVCLLQPLVARPTPEEELGFGWASLPNLWNAPSPQAKTRADLPFQPNVAVRGRKLPAVNRLSQLRRTDSETVPKWPCQQMSPSSSFDQQQPMPRHRLVGQLVQRSATVGVLSPLARSGYSVLRRDEEIREEEEDMETDEASD